MSDSEGPDFHIYYAYELSSTIYQAHYVVGYDSIHWAISYPEHWEWFHKTVKQGQALTILVDPDHLNESIIFGQLETFDFSSGRAKWIANIES